MPADIDWRTAVDNGSTDRASVISHLQARQATYLPRLAPMLCAVTMVLATALGALAQTARLRDNIAPDAMRFQPIAAPSSLTSLDLSIQFLPRNQAALNALLDAQQDPNSPQYHRWLTPEQYSERFGPTETDFAAVSNWLSTSGFHISGGSRQEGFIRFTGSVATAEKAFDARIMTFGDGSRFANTMEPEVPARFASLIGEIVGLNNMGRLESGLRANPAAVPLTADTPLSNKSTTAVELLPALNIGPIANNITFGPTDFYTFYDETPLLQANINGFSTNDCIGLFETSNVFPDILDDFTHPQILDYELPPADISVDLVDGSDPGVNKSEGEAYLDIEWSHAVAPGAQILLYVADLGSSTFGQALCDALHTAVRQNKCGAISISFMTCGLSKAFYTHTLGSIFAQANSQGQTVFVSAGDHGADTCDLGTRNVNELAASPHVASVGGTMFAPTYDTDGNDIDFVPEVAWNQSSLSNAGENETTDGGTSSIFGKPSWQRGLGVPNNGKRDIPDVAMIAGSPYVLEMEALDDYSIYFPDVMVWRTGSGTSLSTPIWAGISRLIQQLTDERLGNMNPTIYKLANKGLVASGFRDVTAGNNTYVNVYGKTVRGYDAGPGFDLTTGWGTVDITTFVDAYSSITTDATPARQR
jgi:subtilase family serine protease